MEFRLFFDKKIRCFWLVLAIDKSDLISEAYSIRPLIYPGSEVRSWRRELRSAIRVVSLPLKEFFAPPRRNLFRFIMFLFLFVLICDSNRRYLLLLDLFRLLILFFMNSSLFLWFGLIFGYLSAFFLVFEWKRYWILMVLLKKWTIF